MKGHAVQRRGVTGNKDLSFHTCHSCHSCHSILRNDANFCVSKGYFDGVAVAQFGPFIDANVVKRAKEW